MFLDEVAITVRSGCGGDGVVSFRREKYVTRGGPDGGNGGLGGSVILRADANKNTLQHFRGVKLFAAQSGERGGRQNKAGAGGEDLVLSVPVGTLIFENKKLLVDLAESGASFCAARGGLGGKGNANFVSSVRQAPRFAELGEPGTARQLDLELKLVADGGIIGLPSVGKSTLISVVSAARPKIAAYHFTTLAPNLGVVTHRDASFVITDLPGLIRGASRGLGLGHKFLRHTERVRFFWHLVDGSSPTPVADYRTIRTELTKFNPALAEKPELVVISKADILTPAALRSVAAKIKKVIGRSPLIISAVAQSGLTALLDATLPLLPKSEPAPSVPKLKIFQPQFAEKSRAFVIKRQNKKLYFVTGQRLSQIVSMSDLENPEALARVQDVLRKFGVTRELARLGAAAGTRLEIAGKRFEWWG